MSDRYLGGCVRLVYSKCDVAFHIEVHRHRDGDTGIVLCDRRNRNAQYLDDPRMPMDCNSHHLLDPTQRLVDRSGGSEQVIHRHRKH